MRPNRRATSSRVLVTLVRCNEVSKALANILTPDKKTSLAWMISFKPGKEFQFRTKVSETFSHWRRFFKER